MQPAPNDPCDICGKIFNSNMLESRFGYVTCVEHEKVPPNERKAKAHEIIRSYHKCPRRAENPVVSTAFLGPDVWNENRWTLSFEEMIEDGKKYVSGGNKWLWDWQPRTCSYCGCSKPEDVLRLLDEGWKHDRTTKNYKGYLRPPINPGDEQWVPVPPVKFFIQHFSDHELSRLNEKIRPQK